MGVACCKEELLCEVRIGDWQRNCELVYCCHVFLIVFDICDGTRQNMKLVDNAEKYLF